MSKIIFMFRNYFNSSLFVDYLNNILNKGGRITNDGVCAKEIRCRLQQAQCAFQKGGANLLLEIKI